METPSPNYAVDTVQVRSPGMFYQIYLGSFPVASVLLCFGITSSSFVISSTLGDRKQV